MLLVAPKLNLNGNWKPVCQRLFNSQRKNADMYKDVCQAICLKGKDKH